jgi:hypothetical protein
MAIILTQKRSVNQIPVNQYKSPALENVGVIGDYRDITDLSKVGLRIPAFISSDYGRFEDFIRAYYSWLSQPTEAIGFGRSLLRERDVSEATIFGQNYKQDYLRPFPATWSASLPITVQHSKELYSSKGSELGVFSFFKVLFNEEPEVIYPREKVLRSSGTKWIQTKIINISNTSGKTIECLGRIIKGMPSVSYAFVESVTLRSWPNATPYYECAISEQKGSFAYDDDIIFEAEDGSTVTEKIIVGVSGFTITDAGNWYLPGQLVTLADNPGVGFSGQVKEVSRGSITDLVITSPGAGYVVGDIISSEVYSKSGIQPVPSNPNQLYDYQVPSLGPGDPVATSVINNLVTKGTGFRAVVTSTGGSNEITGITVTDGGYGFERRPTLYVIPQTLFSGTLANIQVDPNPTKNTQIGKIVSIQIDSYGAYYPVNNTTNYPLSMYPVSIFNDIQTQYRVNMRITDVFYSVSNISVSVSPHGLAGLPSPRTASIQPLFGVVGETKGIYASDKATLSGDQKLQDGYYYQDYSYIIQSGQSLSSYRNLIKSIFHPAGMIIFGQVFVTPNLNDAGTNISAAPYGGSIDEANSIIVGGGARYRNVGISLVKEISTNYFSNTINSDVRVVTVRNFPLPSFNNGSQATITASISGTQLIVTTAAGQIGIGQSITGAGVSGGTVITGTLTGSGGTGTYIVNNSQTVSSTTMSAVLPSPSYNNYPNTEKVGTSEFISKSATKQLIDNTGASDSVPKSPIKRAVDFAGTSDYFIKSLTKMPLENAPVVDVVSKIVTKPLFDYSAAGDAVPKSPIKRATDFAGTSDYFIKSITKTPLELLTVSDPVTKTVSKIFFETLVTYDVLWSSTGKNSSSSDFASTSDKIILNLKKTKTDFTAFTEYFSIILVSGESSIINDSTINSSVIG